MSTSIRTFTKARRVESRNESYYFITIFLFYVFIRSPGFGLSLVAESTTGVLLASEWMGEGGTTPEDVGLNAAKLLYRQIAQGGCVDVSAQWFVLLLMTLCDGNVSKARMGRLSDFT